MRTGSSLAAQAPADQAAPAAVLAVRGVRKRFGTTVAVDGVSLDVRAGEIVALVGPSGCGKSTLLRIAAGLLRADEGAVAVHGTVVDGPDAWAPAERRNVGIVFQDLALFPHLSVADNVAFGLAERSRRGLPGGRRFGGKAERRARVAEMLELVSLGHVAERYPHELSGGEQQRIALARALAPGPVVVLLDEPFSGLDRNLRERVRAQTVETLRQAGATAVLVTHDREEAMAAGDRLAVMRDGTVEQLDDPETVFHAPSNRFVATFMGEADFLPARVQAGQLATEAGDAPRPPDCPTDGTWDIMVRPHEAAFVEDVPGNATVVGAEMRGAVVRYELRLDSGRRLRVLRPHTTRCPRGTRVRAWIDHGHPPALFVGDDMAAGGPPRQAAGDGPA